MSLGRSKSKLPPLRPEYLLLIDQISTLREKITAFSTVEEGVALESQVTLIQRLVERELSEDEKVANFKSNLLHSMDVLGREIEDWSLDDSPSSFDDHRKQTVDLLNKGISYFNEIPFIPTLNSTVRQNLSFSSSSSVDESELEKFSKQNRSQSLSLSSSLNFSSFSNYSASNMASNPPNSLSQSLSSESSFDKIQSSKSLSRSMNSASIPPISASSTTSSSSVTLEEKKKNRNSIEVKESSKEGSGKERMKRLFFGSVSSMKDSNRSSILPLSFSFSPRGNSGGISEELSEARLKSLSEIFESEISTNFRDGSASDFSDRNSLSPSLSFSSSSRSSYSPNELNYNQILKKLKDDLDSNSREKLEQIIKEKGIGSLVVPMEKRRLIFKTMGWEDRRGSLSVVETEKRMKKKRKELQKGNFEKKSKSGLLNSDDLDFLFSFAKSPDPSDALLARNALIALSASAWPVELYPGLRTMILGEHLLESLLLLARKGEILIHNEIPWDQVEVMGMIAEGASAKVFKGKYRGKEVAIKRFDVEHISFSPEEFNQEIAVTSLVQNDNLCMFYGAGTQLPMPFIVGELMSKGTLSEFISTCNEFMDLKGRLNFCLDICKGMTYLHSLHIIHRDLKPHNIMMNENLNCKIIDFGTSRIVDKSMTSGLGTPAWMSPEVLQSDQYTEKADVYSFAIVMWELWTAKEPFSDLQLFAIPGAVIEGKRPPIPENIHPEYSRVMQKCWEGEPQKRPPFKDLVSQFEWMLVSFDNDSNEPKEGSSPSPLP